MAAKKKATKKKATKKPAVAARITLVTNKREAELELNKAEFAALIQDSHDVALDGCDLANRIWEELFCAVGVGEPVETNRSYSVDITGTGNLKQKLLQALANLDANVEEM